MASHLRAGIFASISLLFIVSALFMQGCGGSSASAGGAGRGNPPATPTGLAATPSNHQVSLTWNTATTASSYNVKRSTTSGGPYTRVANATVSNDTDIGLANGTTYYYVVSAVNANGESANSKGGFRDSKHPASRSPPGTDGDRGQPASGSCMECHHGSDEL